MFSSITIIIMQLVFKIIIPIDLFCKVYIPICTAEVVIFLSGLVKFDHYDNKRRIK